MGGLTSESSWDLVGYVVSETLTLWLLPIGSPAAVKTQMEDTTHR